MVFFKATQTFPYKCHRVVISLAHLYLYFHCQWSHAFIFPLPFSGHPTFVRVRWVKKKNKSPPVVNPKILCHLLPTNQTLSCPSTTLHSLMIFPSLSTVGKTNFFTMNHNFSHQSFNVDPLTSF